ncbi:hypothetical protein [Pseudonocardia sp. NPDC046786]|uniref:hypothetical protein n=1 Tax=Pseudonocardia sp. NPDC046786 TaxID=3155471 RepID=UPI00340D7C7C
MVDALRIESQQLLLDAATRARVDGSGPLVALERLTRFAVDHHNRILFLFADPNRFADDSEDEDTTLVDLIERAQAENLLVASLTARWIQSSFYATVHTAAESIADGHLTPSEAADAAVRTLLAGVGADTAPAADGPGS